MRLDLASLDRSLVRAARANAAQAVEQNARTAELRRQATLAQAAALTSAGAVVPGERRSPAPR